jgi:hypothetical protein
MRHHSTGGKIVKTGIVLALLALVAAGVIAVAAQGRSATTLSYVTHQHDFTQVDVGKKGFSVGDSLIFSERLLQGGKAVGYDHIVCVHAASWPSDAESCVGTAVIGGSTLTLAGDSSRGPFTIAVVGGTGSYAGARGSARIVSQGSKGTLVISLV